MVYKTTNPLEYAEVDGIVADEQAPAPQILSKGVGTAIAIGLFGWGPENTLSSVVTKQLEFYRLHMNTSHSGMQALRNKSFSALKIIRVAATGAAASAKTFKDGAGTPVDSITFTAKYKGVMGDNIQVKIEAGTTEGNKYSIKLDDDDNVSYFPEEIYDNCTRSNIVASMANSKLVVPTVLTSGSPVEPAAVTYTALTGGADGTVVDTDYEDSIAVTEQEGAGNFVFLDVYNSTRNGYLKTSAATTQDKMMILAGDEDETPTEAIAAVATLKDVDGRLIYAFNWLETTINGVKQFMSPASFYASIMSNIGPHIDPAFAGNSQYLYGVTDIKQKLSRADYISLMAAGISSFEFDSDIGFKIKSGVVTQTANSEKVTVSRRRMTDFLIDAHTSFLKNYQNAINSSSNRKAIQAAMLNYIEQNLEKNGILPKDSEVNGGLAKLVDIETLNDDTSIGQGFNYILYKQRIWSHMRFIVFKAEIGTGVIVEA